FWNIAVVKSSGDVTRLQALVDKKRIVISEEVVREILQLNDAEGVVCLPNEEIFAGLARMGYEKPSTKLTFYKAFFSTQWKFFIHTILHSLSAKRTSWNEFSSAMASAFICLSSGQRFNFLKYIFKSLVRNVDSTSKFYMYPRFIQLIIQRNIANLSKHTNRYISPVLTQKVFANMRRVGKGFSGVETPLFETMLAVRDIAEEAEAQIPTQDDDVQEHADEEVARDVVSPTPTSPSPSSPVLDKCSTLVLRVEGMETANAAQQLEIIKLKARVKKLERLNKEDTEVQEAVEVVTTAKLITEFVTPAATQVAAASTPIFPAKPKVLKIAAAPTVSTRKRKGVIIRDPEKELHIDTPAETLTVKDKGKGILIEDPKPMKKKDQFDWNAAFDHVQAKETQYIKRYHGFKKKPQSESEARKNMISYLKNTEEMEKEDEEIIKSINETPAQKAAKRRKLSEEAQEADELRRCLEIVQDEDDDVFVEAILLAQKVFVVDYQDAIWRNQKSVHGLALVKRWKLLTSCGVHVIILSTVQLFLLVKRRYPLSRFTLEQLVNMARLQANVKAVQDAAAAAHTKFDENMRFLFKSREEMEEEDQEIIKSINETPAHKAAKRRKLKATPLARKVPAVDYQIVLIDNKPRFKIIRADETYQFYISFITLLKNFDREDLENLWGITMFEKPDGQDAVWTNQRSVHGLALSWLFQKQTALGKDISNPLMADNLPKIVWYSTHHITLMKSWLFQKQTALGKDSSNPLTVDSLLKTIWFLIHHLLTNQVLTIPGQTTTGVNTPRSDEDRLETLELTVFVLQKFWNTVTVKQSADVTRLQALVDKKKVLISEAVIRDVLRLDDAEGVDCLPNEEIFTRLARRKFNFSKYIFDSLVRNVDSSSKFYMYPRMGKRFSGVETPLFEGMLVIGEIEEHGDEEEQDNDDNDAQGADANVSGDDVQD
nr:hypothetical protein [Tanacetum cinerariifolium]